MKVLITGVGGFLGSTFAIWLGEHFANIEVHGIDDFSCGYEENVPHYVKCHQFSLGENKLRDSEAWQEYDYVFHFAAYAAEGLSPFIRQYNYRNNLLATAEIVNLCIEKGVQRLVFTSSMAAYGKPVLSSFNNNAYPPFSENMICRPIDPYGVAKLACEQDIRVAGLQHGLDWCIIRPHNLYGPGQCIWQKYRNVLGNWMARHLQNQFLLVYGDGQQRRAFSWIDDCLPCLWEAAINARASREVINLGGAEPVTIRSAAEKLVKVMKGGKIVHAEARHEVHDAWCTVDKSKDILGYQETTDLEQGLNMMWRWAKGIWQKYPDRTMGKGVGRLEVKRGLYPYWKELLQRD